MIDYGLILLTGVLTGLHCVGMCGAIVLAYSVAPAGVTAGAGQAFLKHIAYNGGRIVWTGQAGNQHPFRTRYPRMPQDQFRLLRRPPSPFCGASVRDDGQHRRA